MQNMYERQIVTYPRTDSRYITSDMEVATKSLIENLLGAGVYDAIENKADIYRADNI